MDWGNVRFEGEYPRLKYHLLPRDGASRCLNCWIKSGTIVAVPGSVRVGTVAFGASVRSIHRFDGTSEADDRWFAWNEDVDVVQAPVFDDTLRRTIWTGDGAPKHTTTTVLGSFSSPGKPTSRTLGVPAPVAAPTVALGAAVAPPKATGLTQTPTHLFTANSPGAFYCQFQHSPNSDFSGTPTDLYDNTEDTAHSTEWTRPTTTTYVRARWTTARDGGGTQGEWSDTVTYTPTLPPKPTGLAATPYEITAATTAERYFFTVQYSTSNTFPDTSATTTVNDTQNSPSHIAAWTATAGTTYYVRGRFQMGATVGPWSDTLTYEAPSTLPDRPAIPRPATLALQAQAVATGPTTANYFCTFEQSSSATFPTGSSTSQFYDTTNDTSHSETWSPPAQGITYVRARYTTAARDGGTKGPWSHIYLWNAPAPAAPPSPPAPTAEVAARQETHGWVFTWLTDLDEEGPPSPVSALLNRSLSESDTSIQSATVTTPTALTGDTGVNRKRIYRTATDTLGRTTYRLVATIPIATAAYTDDTLTSQLGDALQSTTWDPPPAGLKGLTDVGNGVLAGFDDRYVYFSVPYQPHAWPQDYIQTMKSEVVGLGSFGTNVVVGTRTGVQLVSGADPALMQVSQEELDRPCVSKRSIGRTAEPGVVYAAPDGLVLVGPGGARIISQEYYDEDEWSRLGPGAMESAYLDGAYVGMFANQSVAISPAVSGVMRFDDSALRGARATYYEGARQKTYFADADGNLRELVLNEPRAGEDNLEFNWIGRDWNGPLRIDSWAQVIADSYTDIKLTMLSLNPSTNSPPEIAVASSRPFRWGAGRMAAGTWYYRVRGKGNVAQVHIGDADDMVGV